MLKITNLYIIILITILGLNNANAQCKSQVKEGIKKLTPYTHNGQTNNAKLNPGQAAKFNISVYKGLNYRFQVVSDLSNIQFKVYDENNKELYNSSSSSSGSWDFTSGSSQELKVEITSIDKTKNGCVSVLVGMQTPSGNNSIRNF